MHISRQDDIIAAIATPPGVGAIGVVRLSGNGSKEVLGALWMGRPNVQDFETHKLYYGSIAYRGKTIDRVLVTWMKAPRSYTGEDVVEISGHGGEVVLKAILKACCDAGARPSEPGEFTKRAFLNGKMDLAQAEAVADVISAVSEAGLKCAQNQLEGRLSKRLGSIQKRLVELRAFVEASIDFPEEDIELLKSADIDDGLTCVVTDLDELANTFEEGRIAREGVKVVIAGKPNAGKSSLFNALVGKDRAIVHHAPGTTRDVVEEYVQIDGKAFHLRDTAGLCDADDDVEKIGVAKTLDEAGRADIVIYVTDSTADEIGDSVAGGKLNSKAKIFVYSKSDLIDDDRKKADRLYVSAVTGSGLDDLKKALAEKTNRNKSAEAEGVVITNLRHRTSIEEALTFTKKAAEAIADESSAEFVAHHLKDAQDAIGKITGEVSIDSVLDEVFSRFCIGK